MSVRARWGAPALVVDDEDPFQQRVEEVGFPIEIRNGEAELQVELIELVAHENRLYNQGVVCTIKDRADTTCSACPISAHDDPKATLRPLCVLGRKQEAAATALAVARAADADPV